MANLLGDYSSKALIAKYPPRSDTLLQDVRYTFRTLRNNAGFTTFAILIVGLGIGASSTAFSVVNALLLRPLPFRSRQPGVDC